MKSPESYIGASVIPIKIPTPFAVGPVYSYLILDEKTVLVDCGQYEERSYLKVTSALEKQGLGPKDVDEIWLTHGHPDHFGQAKRISVRSGARILGHKKERANFASNNDRELFADYFQSHSIPGKFIQKMVEQLDWLQQFQQPVEPGWINDGDWLDSGNMQYEVKHTPGHAAGHITFAGENGLIFGGDLLLEHITTNALINFDPDTGIRNRSLLQYRESLKWLRNRDGYLLPGHGVFTKDIQSVADHHLSEHEKRFADVMDLLRHQPGTLMKLAFQLFPEAIKRGDAFLALSEVAGYLDWGVVEGEIVEMESDKGLIYRVK